MMVEYHSISIKEAFKTLESREQGISDHEAKVRRLKYGKNELEESQHVNPIYIIIEQFKSPLMLILIAAVMISLFLDETIDALVILSIIILNAILGFIQEYKAEKAIEALKKLASPHVRVLRNGKEKLILSSELVPGDIMLIETGDKISADALLIEISNLHVQEASLTGESTPVAKELKTLKASTQIADRTNMIFSGTIVTAGRAHALVTSTGMKTEIGKIAHMISASVQEPTPLQKKLKTLASFLGIAVIVICIIVFLAGIIRGLPALDMFLTAIALAVAAIPEGLPAVVTISLALGIQRMAKRNALMRKLPTVETLGSCTVICSDKTGTLTHNEMTVTKLYVNSETIDVTGSGYEAKGEFSRPPENFKLLLNIGILNNDSKLTEEDGKKTCLGDPTEGCLLVAAQKAGIDYEAFQKKYPRIDEIQFTSERKRMTTVHKAGNKKIAYMKGAPDIVLKLCDRIIIDGKVRRITRDDVKAILDANENFASQALRVLGFSYKELGNEKEIEKGMTFVGLQAMIDPPRKEAAEAIARCKEAGIKVVMITGDHLTTAKAIAKQLGIIGKAIIGADLDRISLDDEVENISIYARVDPSHKKTIIDALRKKGHIIAMTGDGVNDAPALKDADIGISMGITGTDVAKEASDMILTDDNFASIVGAIEEGRGIYDNIKKFVNYLLSSNLGEVLVLFIATLLGWPLPLAAIQILWMNLITDGLPALALGVDPIASDIMQRKPRHKSEQIMSSNMIFNIIVIGILICIGTLYVFDHELSASGNLPKARTLAFSTLVVLQLVRIYMVRAKYKLGIFSNRYLILAILSSITLQMIVIYSPLNIFFKTVPLSSMDWALMALVSAALLVLGMVSNMIITKATHQID